MIYLDYNATAPVRPEVLAVMQELQALSLNPSSIHASGRYAKKILEDSRKTIAERINCFPNEVIFCGCGSEANNWALSAFGKVLVSSVEHSSVLKTTQARHSREGGNPETIPVDSEGIVSLEWLDTRLANKDIAVVSVMLANNETGVIQPIREVAAITRKHNVLLHCDAVQALGKIAFDYSQLGADMVTLSAHKMGGPVGAAALIVRNNLPIKPFIVGGGQELNRRAGTENIPAIAGFAEAIARIDLDFFTKLQKWFQEMEQGIASIAPKAVIFGKASERLPNTSCIAMPNAPSETQLIAFDIEKIAVSAGSACSSGTLEPSHVLKAMGIIPEIASCAIRISGGWKTRHEELKTFANAWKNLYLRLNKNAA
jgi:cysteine desulfurase